VKNLAQYNTPRKLFKAPLIVLMPLTRVPHPACFLLSESASIGDNPRAIGGCQGVEAGEIGRPIFGAPGTRRFLPRAGLARQKSHHNVARRNPLDRDQHSKLNAGGGPPSPLPSGERPGGIRLGLGGFPLAIEKGASCS
jgi:hypothetical protein